MSLIRPHFTRRQILRLGTATFFASMLGLRKTNAAPTAKAGFQFIVVNDTHYTEAECGIWLANAVRQMKIHNADFCVIDGDLSENGRSDQLGAVCDIFNQLGIPVYKIIGNHDYVSDSDRSPFLEICGPELNYQFSHKGWQFVALDSTEGTHAYRTQIQPQTFTWLDRNLPLLDKSRPTVLFTHFPLGRNITRPTNADELLSRFESFQLREVFNGHWHGLSESTWRDKTPIVTDRCCSRLRENRDGSKEKGYFLCRAESGGVTKRFIPVTPA
jgi:3',5'-cyclic AMP phosphodiesterase CpdA